MSNATWMSDLASYIRDVPLLNIVLPGTHDSGTYAITRNSPVSPDAPPFVKDVEDIFDDPFFYYWLYLLHATFDTIVAGWAKAQDKDISAQLEAGIRYLDCRVCRDGDVTRICHGMFAENTDVVLDAVSDFIKQNPNEIVILDFNHFYEMTAESHVKLVSKIISTFGTALAPNALTPGVTIGDLWEGNYQVVVIYHCDSDDTKCVNATKDHPQLWPKSSIWSPWPDERDVSKLKSDLINDLGKRSSSHANQLFVLQGVLTPNGDTVKNGVNPFKDYPRDLENIADSVTPTVVEWVKNLWNNQPLNIIIVDWFERADLIGVAKSLNRGFETIVNWTAKAREYDTGSLLAVALNNNGSIVDIHCGSPDHNNQYKHYYRVGTLNAGAQTIGWGPYHEYDTGSILAVAMDNDGNVVGIHCGSPGPGNENKHYYDIGKLTVQQTRTST